MSKSKSVSLFLRRLSFLNFSRPENDLGLNMDKLLSLKSSSFRLLRLEKAFSSMHSI